MPALFDPLTLRAHTVRNRLWVSPMCQYSVSARDGVPTRWHLVHLGSFAVGGAGLVMTEATAVEPIGRISPEDTGIWNREQTDAWAGIVETVHAAGASAGIQLAHAGRKASTRSPWGPDLAPRPESSVPADEGGWATVSASAEPYAGLTAPQALDEAGIARVVEAFARAAGRAREAGFDVIEVHAAHGYLLHQFLSPLSNRRTDGYGGDLAGRARLVLEVVAAVRAEIGEDVPLFVRMSATDYAEGGWDLAQTAIVAEQARDAGADLIDVSSGGNVPGVRIPLSPGYQVPFAEHVRREAGVPVNAVGLITTARQADDIVREGRADAVMMGRALLRNPHLPLLAADELGAGDGLWPGPYLRARPPAASGS